MQRYDSFDSELLILESGVRDMRAAEQYDSDTVGLAFGVWVARSSQQRIQFIVRVRDSDFADSFTTMAITACFTPILTSLVAFLTTKWHHPIDYDPYLSYSWDYPCGIGLAD